MKKYFYIRASEAPTKNSAEEKQSLDQNGIVASCVHVVHYTEGGLLCAADPRVFLFEEDAGRCFESNVSDRGFRAKYNEESWDDYTTAFHEWENSENVTYDKDDFNIAWWTVELEAPGL